MGIQERKKREKEERQESILDSAKELFYSQGFHDTTMAQIAKSAELAKGTLYLYFKSKEELAATIIYRTLQGFHEFIKAKLKGNSGLQKIRSFTEIFVSMLDTKINDIAFTSNMDAISARLGEDNSTVRMCFDTLDKHVQILVDLGHEGQADGSIRKDVDIQKTAFIFADLFIVYLQRMASDSSRRFFSGGYDQKDMVQHMIDMLLFSIEVQHEEN